MVDNTFKIIVLENAYRHKGKADIKFAFGSVISKFPEWREKQKELSAILIPIISDVNALSLDEQEKEIENLAPELLEKKEKEDRNIYAFMHIKPGDKVVTCFPPSPEKYPHIGHSKAILLNYLLAKQYGGKFYLRFEDTNPRLVKPEFYIIMQEDFEWQGVRPDKIIYASDHIDLLKEQAEKLILKGQAYMCFCNPDKMSELREKQETCDCRFSSPEQNLINWKEMESYPEGKASLRLKIDLKHKNTRMR
ncbi:MAG: glutamate--tRNA ligase family protein, partial [archaeon]